MKLRISKYVNMTSFSENTDSKHRQGVNENDWVFFKTVNIIDDNHTEMYEQQI